MINHFGLLTTQIPGQMLAFARDFASEAKCCNKLDDEEGKKEQHEEKLQKPAKKLIILLKNEQTSENVHFMAQEQQRLCK